MKTIQQGIQKYELTSENITEVAKLYVEKHGLGKFKTAWLSTNSKLENSHYIRVETIGSFKENPTPFKAINSKNIFDLEKEDIKEALAMYLTKQNLGTFHNLVFTTEHIPGDVYETMDYGSDKPIIQFELKQ